MSDEQHNELVLGFETLRPETSVNWQSPEDPNQQIRVSDEILTFIRENGIAAELQDTGKNEGSWLPVIRPPSKLADDSLPLANYFISSSHNTYLLSRQLVGRASAESYTHVLGRNGCCIEIDVWPSSKGPVVTHGYTLSTSVPFESVCVAIGDAINEDHWPVLVSLECHVPEEGQDRLVDIMKGAWGDKLVDTEIPDLAGDHNLTPKDIMGRILLMVEYYPPKAEGVGLSSDDFSDDSAVEEAESEQGTFPRKHAHGKISPSLAALGYYARSMKPDKNWLTEQLSTPPYPPHILINISEPSLLELIPAHLSALISHAQTSLRRIYPEGTRITSHNFNPLEFWQNGSQIASLNWQHYDLGMQINEAMFVGSRGWVTKPGTMMRKGDEVVRKMKFIGEIVGISSLPRPENKDSFSAYVRAELFHSGGKQEWKSKVVKVTSVQETGVDIAWHEINDQLEIQRFEWGYQQEDLAFIRLMVIRHHEILEHEDLAVFCARIDHLQSDWRLVRLLDMKGKHIGATVLARLRSE